MGKALKQTPTAWVWATAIVVSYLLAGVMVGLTVAADGRSQILQLALGVGGAGLVSWAVAVKARWVAATPIGRWWWFVAIWFCADNAIERQKMLEELHEDGESI